MPIDKIAMLTPRIVQIVHETAHGSFLFGAEFDKFVFHGGGRKIGIAFATLEAAFDSDDYAGIDRAVRHAVHYVSGEMGPLFALAAEVKSE